MRTMRNCLLLLTLSFLVACSTTPKLINDGIHGGDYKKRSVVNKRVVVFIHGVFGDQHGTWRNANGEEWPVLLAGDEEMSTFDIYAADYFSPFSGRAADIDEIGTRLRKQFEDRGIFKYPEIYIIAHSMGGLVAKAILLDLNTPANVATLRKVKAILFLSTPAQGAPIADVAAWISNNPQVKEMSPDELNTFLQRLERQWQALLRERNTLGEQWPLVYCAYEKQKVAGLSLVVPRLYTATNCDEDPYAMDQFDHLSIAKPASRQSDQYTWAKGRIIQTASRQPAAPVTIITTHNSQRTSNISFSSNLHSDAEYEELLLNNQTRELELARWGAQAFKAGAYDWSLKFFRQAQRVESSLVWHGSYPYLAGSLFKVGRPDEAKAALDKMLAFMKSKTGYLSFPTTQGFVINSLGEIKDSLSDEDRNYVDQIIMQAIDIKNPQSAIHPISQLSEQPSFSQIMTNSPGGIQAGRDVVILKEKPQRSLGDRRADLITELRKAGSHQVAITVARGNMECLTFAKEIESAFIEAGWTIGRSQIFMVTQDAPGIIVSVKYPAKPTPGQMAVGLAFKKIGMKISADADSSLEDRDPVEIYVGLQ